MPLPMLLAALSILMTSAIFLRRGRDQRLRQVAWGRPTTIAALIPLALQILVLALFGLGEMASGDLSGAGHLIPLIATVIVGFLAWKRPMEGGIALIVVGLATFAQYHDPTARMIMAAPQLLSGTLFLAAGVGGWTAERRKAALGP